MGTTAAGWNVTGALAVTSTSAFTGNVTMAGTHRVTGAASFYSTLYTSGASTFAGTATFDNNTRVTTQFGVGAAATLADVSASTHSYTWAYCDGTNSFTVPRFRAYDYGTGAYRIVYLSNGSFIAS